MRRFLLYLLVCLCLLLPLTALTPGVVKITTAEGSPVLLTQANSTRAVALESPSLMREPFSATSSHTFDGRNRIILFSDNLTLLPGEPASVVRASAEDNNYQFHTLSVEYVGKVPDLPQLTQIVVRLGNTLRNDTGDVLVQITYHGLVSNRVRVGIGHIGDGPNVLEFDGYYKSVDYGDFWEPDVDLGHFFWEFWAMPGANASERYLLSDGYGGAHALLFGFSSDSPTDYFFNGNVWNGTGAVNFASDEGPNVNEWGHFAVGWDGNKIVTYFNGVPVGKSTFNGPRREFGPAGGGGRLLIGGSDHQNLVGRIWQLRGYENANPREQPNDGLATLAAFVPQTYFEGAGATLISSFTRSSLFVPDRSGNNHFGTVRSTVCGIPATECPGAPLPEFVVDPTAPNIRGAQPTMVDHSWSMPFGARLYDSFSRPNSTYAFDGIGGLDLTESGSGGRQVWNYAPSTAENGLAPFGILNGRAVVLANRACAAWVPTGNGSANVEIRVSRRSWHARAGNGISTGLVFRFRDLDNFFYAYTSGDTAATQTLKVGSVVDRGPLVLASNVPMPPDWTELRVITLETGEITIYAGTALLFSTNVSELETEKKAGLWNSGAGQALANRWDDFAVLEAPLLETR